MKNSKNSRFHCNCCTITIACNLSTTLQQWKSWRFAHGALHLKTLLEKRSVGRCSLCNGPRVISFNLHVRHIVFRYSPSVSKVCSLVQTTEANGRLKNRCSAAKVVHLEWFCYINSWLLFSCHIIAFNRRRSLWLAKCDNQGRQKKACCIVLLLV